MKNKRFLVLLTITAALSGLATGCFGGDDPAEQVIVDETPTPEPTQEPTPEPTIAPDVQDTTYTSSDGAVTIKLPDATWANKSDAEDMISFESPEQGKILVLHGAGEEDMSSAMIPNTQDLAAALEQASDLEQGTDFEIQNYNSTNVNGVGIYSYTVKYLNTEKSGGYAYAVKKVYANESEYYSITGSVVNDASLTGIQLLILSRSLAHPVHLLLQILLLTALQTVHRQQMVQHPVILLQVQTDRPAPLPVIPEDLHRSSSPIPIRQEQSTVTLMDIRL